MLQALGLTVDRRSLPFTDTTTDELDVPVVATVETGSGLHLVALEAELADDVDGLFAGGQGEQGRLVEPIHKVGEKLELVDPADAVSALFAVDDPPRWVLVVAGGIVLLAERAKWAEGRFLAVDLDTALERNDTGAKGELETIAALFSTDALVPRDGQAVIDQLADNSIKHAVGVSKELREGVRHSIEILANEVIQRRLKKNLGVYAGDNRIDPRDLTTQCLRYLYRLLVLLYAESRPELGIVPVNDEVYIAGYSLDRLRELTLTDLDTDGSRSGTHLDQSLRSLFELVNEGYHAENVTVEMLFEVEKPEHDYSYEDYLQFPGLDAQLFAPSAVPLIDSVTLRNESLQKILQLLMLSPESKGKRADRGFISYAQLGINQLGAVYEGLMAYTGFFADEDLYEVAKNGDPSDGTWVLPVGKADEYPEEVFVTREDPLTGAEERILHPKGSFVFRLSGRDRQRSASYYTPEVLTRCVVKHALAELLGTDDYAPENGSSGITEAREILDLTICEPALGSGAFLNEAINQLSAEYLRRRQAELGVTLDPEQYNRELQKVKAHFALHQSYGVDLNATAVELAEVSLWLNCMHPGLKAPWFGMQLRQGNSLVGCRRATWRTSQFKSKPWAKATTDHPRPPVERPLTEELGEDEIHHFLLPGHGWAAVADRSEASKLYPDQARQLKDWRKAILEAPSPQDVGRLQVLASGVERLWVAATERLRLAQKSLRRPIEVWGAGKMATRDPADRRKAIAALENPDSELGRLRMVMDAWVGLWFWKLDAEVPPPTWKQWLSAMEDLIGRDATLPAAGQLDLFEDLDALLESDDRAKDGRLTSSEVMNLHPWLGTASSLARGEGAWHWALEFAHASSAGGFDLQVGNPPWVVWSWDEDSVVGEFLPAVPLGLREFALTGASSSEARMVIGELASHCSVQQLVTSPIFFPASAAGQANLYRTFVERTEGLINRDGIVGLMHPAGFLSDKDSGRLRRLCLPAMRRLFKFVNQLKLFEDVGNAMPYSVTIRDGQSRDDPSFVMICNVLHPRTVDESMDSNSSETAPPLKSPSGRWVLSGGVDRIVRVGAADLKSWNDLAAPDPTEDDYRILSLHSAREAEALRKLAASSARLDDFVVEVRESYSEESLTTTGAIERGAIEVPLSEGVLNSPNVGLLNAAYQQSNRKAKTHRDYELVSPDAAGEDLRYRARRTCGLDDLAGLRDFRAYYKRWIDPKGERTMQAGVIPPGTIPLAPIAQIVPRESKNTLLLAGWMASLPIDYLCRIQDRTNLYWDALERLPADFGTPLKTPLEFRAARLTCLTSEYSALWEKVFDVDWQRDNWSISVPGVDGHLSNVESSWSTKSALTRDADRRLAEIEIDALVALALGLSARELVQIYRGQFAVLFKYENAIAFDAQGRRLARDPGAVGPAQWRLQKLAQEGGLPKEWKSIWKLYERWEEDPDSVDWMGHYTPPFYRPDREAEMTAAYNEFQRRLETGFYGEVTEGASA